MVDARIILHGEKRAPSGFDAVLATVRKRHPDKDIIVQPTYEAGDAHRLAVEACALGGGRVIAAGGDGTLHEVATGLASGKDCSMGIVPLGTANDFASAAGIPEALVDALEFALTGTPTKIDAGCMKEELFLNLATGGFGPNITSQTPEPLKRSLGGFAYMAAAFAKVSEFSVTHARVEGDDFEWQGNLHAFAVGNARLAGGGHEVCPDALVDDGMLDIAVLPELDEGRWLEALRLSMNFGWQALEAEVMRWRTSSVSFELDREIHVNLDGEAHKGSHFDFEVLAARLDVVLPPESDLLSKEET